MTLYPGSLLYSLKGRRVVYASIIDGVNRSYSRTLPAVARMGFTIRLDPNNRFQSAWLASGVWEPEVTSVILSIIGRGMTFVDVGANNGYYTLLAAEKVGTEGHVYSFEPFPGNYARLASSVADNRFGNVTLIDPAVSQTLGYMRLYNHPRKHRPLSSQELGSRICNGEDGHH